MTPSRYAEAHTTRHGLSTALGLGIWLAGGGSAYAQDTDGDNYSDADELLFCDVSVQDPDLYAAPNPGEEEILGDGLDNDCDGLTDILARPYMRGWWSPPVGPLDWTLSGGASRSGDVVTMPPGSTASWDVTGAAPFTWNNGLLLVTVAMRDPGGPFGACTLTVDSDLAPAGPVTVSLDTIGTTGGVTVAIFDDGDLGPARST